MATTKASQPDEPSLRATGGVAVGLEERVEPLRAFAPFTTLSEPALAALAGRLGEERFEPGMVVFSEGDPGDRLFIVVEGNAELSAAGRNSPVPLAVLEPGEVTGELSLLAGRGRRNASLTALTPLTLLTLTAKDFHTLLDAHPDVREAFEHHADDLLTARFIRQVGPFMTLDDPSRRWLAKQVTHHYVEAGEAIVRQGEIGRSCYLLRQGRVEVVLDDDGTELVVASMDPGGVFGEAALLTDAPRTATVRAAEPSEVLELQREDLDALLDRSRTSGREMVQLFRLQERPRRATGVQVAERRNDEGDTFTVLKHPEALTYYRLSARGRFIWDQLDGHNDMRALTIAFFKQFGELAPHQIAGVVEGLARTKMIDRGALGKAVGQPLVKPGRGERALATARRLLTAEVSLRDIDARITKIYGRGIRLMFSPAAQVLLAVIAIGGLVAFVALAGTAHRTLRGPQKELLLLVIPGTFVSIFLHEAAHAFTVKRFDREINRAGVGWYWFAPVAFVDTSDMWLEGRRERILVSLAGPYCDLIIAGAISLAALAVTDDIVAALLWSFALPSYIAVVSNLNPLLEYDGYHVLTDLLDRPNLRAEAMSWLGTNFPANLRDRAARRRHRTDLAYSLGSVVFIIASVLLVVALYRITLQGLIETIAPAAVASALAWALALAVALLATLGVAADLRAVRRAT